MFVALSVHSEALFDALVSEYVELALSVRWQPSSTSDQFVLLILQLRSLVVENVFSSTFVQINPLFPTLGVANARRLAFYTPLVVSLQPVETSKTLDKINKQLFRI